jgi:Domain of unknown function (DUF6249)
MEGEAFIAITSIIFSLGVLPLSILYFINRGHDKKMESIVKIVELGGAVDPEMLKTLGGGRKDYKSDYKAGLVWLAIGLPVFAGIWLDSGASEAVFGSIPMLIGLAYIVSGKYRLRGEDDK